MEDLLGETVRLLQCLVARDTARSGVTQQVIATFLKTEKAEVSPMVQGIKRAMAYHAIAREVSEGWWARQDSNLRQHRYERRVLTN